jgi:two-component system OmpR family sensor kinase
MASARWERPRTELRSVRSRVLATTLGLLAAALLLVGGLTHYLRLVDLDATAEEPFTDVAQLFCTFMTTTVPGEHESILVLVDGEPAFEHAHRSRFQLDAPATVAAVAERARPGRTVVFDHEQDGRALRLG